ncbi:LPS assembly outer membrane complex protein LptD, partial [Pasteurella multocida subsp. multocida str. Anand1_cattle]
MAFHAEPSINLPLSNRYGSLNIETKLYATHYQQTQGRAAEAEQVERKSIVSCHKSKVDLQTVLASQQT